MYFLNRCFVTVWLAFATLIFFQKSFRDLRISLLKVNGLSLGTTQLWTAVRFC